MRRANVWKKAACVALSLLYFLQIKPQVVQAADYLAGRTGSTVTVRDTDGDVDGDGSVRKKQR